MHVNSRKPELPYVALIMDLGLPSPKRSPQSTGPTYSNFGDPKTQYNIHVKCTSDSIYPCISNAHLQGILVLLKDPFAMLSQSGAGPDRLDSLGAECDGADSQEEEEEEEVNEIAQKVKNRKRTKSQKR